MTVTESYYAVKAFADGWIDDIPFDVASARADREHALEDEAHARNDC